MTKLERIKQIEERLWDIEMDDFGYTKYGIELRKLKEELKELQA